MHKHLKTKHSDSYIKYLDESLDKDKSPAPEPPKKRKFEAFRQTSLDEVKSIKLLDIKDLKAISVHKKL